MLISSKSCICLHTLQATVDPFWLLPQKNDILQPFSADTMDPVMPAETVKPHTTKEERLASMMSGFKAVAELASNSNSATSAVNENILSLFAKLSMNKVDSITNKSDDKVASTTNLVGNPQTKQRQNQNRKQPYAIGAPTTASNKAASRASARERKATEKAKSAAALGK